jgi:hypothetical protein
VGRAARDACGGACDDDELGHGWLGRRGERVHAGRRLGVPEVGYVGLLEWMELSEGWASEEL